MIATPNVATASAERKSMDAAWDLISDVREGLSAIRARGPVYLPRFEDETQKEHERRIATAPWRPEFNDALASLTARPFTRDIALGENASEGMKALYENADQRGNNLTVFGKAAFEGALADGWAAIMADYPVMGGARTVADERATGARPYLVHIKAADVIALYTRFEAGKEVIEHMRIRETETTRNGYGEVKTNYVRVLEPGVWQLWREVKVAIDKVEWVLDSEGAFNRAGKTSVPVAFIRLGTMHGNIKVKPPLIDLAEMQIELFRAMSRKDETMVYSAHPMLKVIGASAPEEALKTGPRRAIYVPPGEGNAAVDYLVPPAANIKEIREDIAALIDDMRRLGMQPMIQKANVSAVGTITDSAKAHSVLQSWATKFKDALEQALTFAAEYIGEPQGPEVSVHTDFAAGMSGPHELDALNKARAGGDISGRTLRNELSRRGVLGPQFDPEEEDEAIASEGGALEDDADLDPATGG